MGKPWKWPLHWQILVALVLGAGVGWLIGRWAVASVSSGAVTVAKESTLFIVLKLFGDLFLRALQLVVVPLVTSSIILSVAQMGGTRDFGRLGWRALVYYLCTSTLAILIGLTLVNIFQPGTSPTGQGILQDKDLSAFREDQAEIEKRVGSKTAIDFLDVFRTMIPPNVVQGAAEANLLGLIVVSLFVGYFLSRLEGRPREVLESAVSGVYAITMSITGVVLCLAPIGVFGLVAVTIAEQYAKLIPDARFGDFARGIVIFALVALAALVLHMLISMPLILAFVARVNPLRHYRAMAPALMTAFSTASSNATLPVNIDCVEKRAGVSNKVASFVLPLGATVNMDGTALYECVAAMFICQAFGVELSAAQQVMIVITALLTSVGVAGVPAASLVAIVVILNAVERSLPPGALPAGTTLIAGMGLLFVFDRPLDMCRTCVNIFSDSVGAVVVARSIGERTLLTGDGSSDSDASTSAA